MNDPEPAAIICPQCSDDLKLIGGRTLKCQNTACRWQRLLPIIKEPGTSADAMAARVVVCIHRGFRRELLELLSKLLVLARLGEDAIERVKGQN